MEQHSNPTTNPASDDAAMLQNILTTLTNLAESSQRSIQNQERSAAAQEALVRLKELTSKLSISEPVAAFIKNAFTSDGINPLADIPPQLKELMTTSPDVTFDNVDLILHKSKTPASPTVDFTKALQSGSYTYPIGQPGNLTPMGIPHSLVGSNLGNIDVKQLLTAETNNKDDISTKDRTILNSAQIVPPDTTYSAMKMVNAFVTILKTGGESTLALAMSDMATWIKDHEEILEENTRTFDRLLPSKMVYALGDATNNYFKSAKYAIPNQQWLNFDHLKMGLLSNNHSIMLPPAIIESLATKRKREEDTAEDEPVVKKARCYSDDKV